MTTHRNDNSLKWQLAEMTTSQRDNSPKWQLSEMTTRRNDNSLKWQLAEMTTGQRYNSPNLHKVCNSVLTHMFIECDNSSSTQIRWMTNFTYRDIGGISSYSNMWAELLYPFWVQSYSSVKVLGHQWLQKGRANLWRHLPPLEALTLTMTFKLSASPAANISPGSGNAEWTFKLSVTPAAIISNGRGNAGWTFQLSVSPAGNISPGRMLDEL